ncbi:MAG: hypothetical protein SFT94_10480 [Pseudanabaenaceae cyanobacterium bins.68]|nr:hypothetical protein [Pseudanabaenaceae cyanobacterium bins.68]
MLPLSFSNLTAKVCAAIALSSFGILSAPLAQANPNLTDADQFPHQDHPPTYLEALNKVLDLTADPNLHAPIFDATFRDLLFKRQNNAYRTVVKEMWDQQASGSPRIRTRDIASPFTTQLSCFSSYYYSSGIEVPSNFSADCPSTVEFAEVVKEPEAPREPVYTAPSAPSRPQPPVRGLW